MCRVVERYLDGPCDSPSHQLKQLLANDDPTDSEHITAVTQLWCEIFDNEETWLTTSVCVTCFAILWLALKGEGVSSMVATTLDAAAGLAQRQKWGLILPSSARVSLLTYQIYYYGKHPYGIPCQLAGGKSRNCKHSATRVKKKWKTRDGIYQLKDPEPSEEDIAETDDTTYAELLREV